MQPREGRNLVHKQKRQAAALAGSTSYETALRECAAGRVSGISGIYANEATQMRAVARRIVRDRDYADDVIHEAFAQILRDAKDFDPSRGSARAWIYTIVRNTALKLRMRRSAEIAVGEEGLQSLQDEFSSGYGRCFTCRGKRRSARLPRTAGSPAAGKPHPRDHRRPQPRRHSDVSRRPRRHRQSLDPPRADRAAQAARIGPKFFFAVCIQQSS